MSKGIFLWEWAVQRDVLVNNSDLGLGLLVAAIANVQGSIVLGDVSDNQSADSLSLDNVELARWSDLGTIAEPLDLSAGTVELADKLKGLGLVLDILVFQFLDEAGWAVGDSQLGGVLGVEDADSDVTSHVNGA